MQSSTQGAQVPIRIVIAEPNAMARGLLSQGLQRQSQFEVLGGVGQVNELLDLLDRNHVDIVLISSAMEAPPFSEHGILPQLRLSYPNARGILLTDRAETEVIVQAFQGGARGVLDRSSSNFKTLCKCVTCVHKGQIWAAGEHIELLLNALSQMPRLRIMDTDGLSLLTRREEDVVRLVAESMSNRQISERLDLSEHTVKNYLFRIFDKLGISNRMELVLYAINSAKESSFSAEPAAHLDRVGRPGPASMNQASPSGESARRFKPGRLAV